jgi:hypothetical protein
LAAFQSVRRSHLRELIDSISIAIFNIVPPNEPGSAAGLRVLCGESIIIELANDAGGINGIRIGAEWRKTALGITQNARA